MPQTYTPIASTTLTSATADITFSSISGSYTDLIIVSNFGSDAAAFPYIRFNSDSGANYSTTDLYGNGTSAGSARQSGGNQIWLSLDIESSTPIQNNMIVNLQNYSNTTTFKTVLTRMNNSSIGTTATVGLWRNTAAITSLTISAIKLGSTRTFSTGSTFTLYGIKAA